MNRDWLITWYSQFTHKGGGGSYGVMITKACKQFTIRPDDPVTLLGLRSSHGEWSPGSCGFIPYRNWGPKSESRSLGEHNYAITILCMKLTIICRWGYKPTNITGAPSSRVYLTSLGQQQTSSHHHWKNPIGKSWPTCFQIPWRRPGFETRLFWPV